jgi:type II secretory pathway pseudopilin PulG
VIGLLAFLAAMTFPLATAVRRSSNMTSCRENMRQILQALKMYESDEGVLPPYLSYYDASADPSNNPLKRGFRDGNWPLRSYVRDTNIFHCPADELHKSEVDDPADPEDIVSGVDSFGNAIQGLLFYSFDSYSGQIDQSSSSDGLYHQTYALDRPVDNFPNGDPNRKRLMKYRLKPETTVVTWCTYHRDYDRDKDNNKMVRRGSEDILLTWSGTAKQVPADQTLAAPGFQVIGD